MQSDRVKPNPCIDCGAEPIAIPDEWGRPIMTPWAYECPKCSRIGALAETEEQAMYNWNEVNE